MHNFMSQQTAVEMMLEYLQKHGFDMEYEMELSFLEWEKEKIMKAYDDGAIETMREQEGLDISKDQNGEESERYYNKKYGK